MKKDFPIQPREKSLKILKALAAGVNPVTKEDISHDSVFELSIVTRALLEAIQSLEERIAYRQRVEKKLERKKAQPQPENHGRKWTQEETDKLLNEYNVQGWSVKEIAKEHGRSERGIILKLENLKVVSENN